ncbi:MAG: hypothetical protein LKCHEGNO_02906 [Burkholderiaceae bacterium]|nr:hypothetical protein [Burkholderiaceae bacterium]
MARRDYVFGYEAEPADERPTDYRTTSFGSSGMASLYTAPAPWSVSEQSTFDEPSRAIERVRERREQGRLKARLAVLSAVLAAVGLLAAGVWLARS